MNCYDLLFADIDTQIDCEVDCAGCPRTDCDEDKRKRSERNETTGSD